MTAKGDWSHSFRRIFTNGYLQVSLLGLGISTLNCGIPGPRTVQSESNTEDQGDDAPTRRSWLDDDSEFGPSTTTPETPGSPIIPVPEDPAVAMPANNTGGQGQPATPAQPEGEYPVPVGYRTKGSFNTEFKFWNRYETNYASGGSGPSQRWDNKKMQLVNMVAGFEFKIGPNHGKRGDDSIGLKFPRCESSGGNRGNYIPSLNWKSNGGNSTGGVGKEIPHPNTTHEDFNVDDPRPEIGNIKDGQWHGFMAVIYNDKDNVPTIEVYYNKTASGRSADYVFVGRSKDSGSGNTKISPGKVLRYSGENGDGGHDLQIRIDEIPRDSLEIRKAYAVELEPPTQ